MAITEDAIKELTNYLESDSFDINKFNQFFKSINLNGIKVKLIDFEYFNEKRLEEATKAKIASVQSQNFEKAAANRVLEKECQKYVNLKNEFNIAKSTFYFEENYLFYFYLGTAKNDELVSKYLKKDLV